MNTTDLKPIPARPSLDQYRKQAKDLVKLVGAGDVEAAQRISKSHPRPGLQASFTLADAHLAIAREHGFQSWPRFVKHIEALNRQDSPVSNFESVADAIVTGDLDTLASLLRTSPELVGARSTRVHRATLLHYLGANGFEDYRQKTPGNAVEAARILLDTGAAVDAVADIYGKSTTLGLVATSVHPKQAGVQIELLDTLLKHGAAIEGVPGLRSPLLAALHNGRPEAAEFLARRGARLDLEAAAGLGLLDVVESFFNPDGSLRTNATEAQMESGFLWACEYGRNSVVDFLLKRGVDAAAQANTGLTGLQWAVVGAQVETIQLLLQHGACLEARNVYGGTALGQALWSAVHGDSAIDYVPVIEMLVRAGAQT